MKRSAFIDRVRAALATTNPRPRPLPPRSLRRLDASADLSAAFVEACSEVGVTGLLVTRGELSARLDRILGGMDTPQVVYGPRAAARLGQPAATEAALRAGPSVAITEAEVAIAETATLGFDTDVRSPWLAIAAHTHIVLVDVDRLVPDLIDALGDPPGQRARFFVTGPSKTADIEGVLVTGVHGPAELIVLLVAPG